MTKFDTLITNGFHVLYLPNQNQSILFQRRYVLLFYMK